MKKHFLTLIAIATFTTVSIAQVGVNSDNSAPHPSAQLDIKSTDKGLLIPRLTTLERNAIQTPEIGLMVFDKDLQEIFIYNSDGWKQGTLSRLPLELSSGSFKNILKVTNTKTNSYPGGTTAAEFINIDILGIAVSAKASGNLPSIFSENEFGSGIESKSNGFGYGGYFSSESGVGIGGLAQNNFFLIGSNNSNTLPTAKFTNNGSGPAMELNSELKIVNSSISNAAIFATSGSIGPTINIRATGNGPAVYGNSTSSESGYFESTNGRAIVGGTGNNVAITGSNNSTSNPTAKFTNNGEGRAMELIGGANITSTSINSLRVENNLTLSLGTGNEAAGLFIHNGPFGSGIIGRSYGSGRAIEANAYGVGPGISATSKDGNGGYFFSENNNSIAGYSLTKSAIDMNNSTINHPTARFSNYQPNGKALELNGNLELNGKINQEAYQTPTFENNWNNFGGEWNTAKFYKGKDSRVYLEGVVSGGTNFLIYTLPVGYRPASRIFFIVSHNGSSRGRIDIASNGEVRFEFGSNNIQVGLDGISFRVE